MKTTKKGLALLLAMLVFVCGSMTVLADDSIPDEIGKMQIVLSENEELSEETVSEEITQDETTLYETADETLFSEMESLTEEIEQEVIASEITLAEENTAAERENTDDGQEAEPQEPEKTEKPLFALAKAPALKNYKDGLKVSWKKVKNADGYRVYRKTKPEVNWTALKTVSDTGYLDETAKAGKTYQYLVLPFKKVSGKNQYAEYDNSSAASVVRLLMPQVDTIKAKTNGLQISWKKTAGAKTYNIYRKTTKAGSWKKIGTSAKTSYLDKTAKRNKTYYYTVAAVNGNSTGSYGSHVLRGYRLAAPKLNKVVMDTQGLNVSWNKVKNASGYRVYRVLSGGKLKFIGKTKKTTFLDKKVKNNTKYTYTVRAYNSFNKHCLSTYNKKGKSKLFSDPVRLLAKERLKACGGSLRKAFEWANRIRYISTQDGSTTSDFAKYTFEHSQGDCLGKASAFCYMARELGYDAHVMRGWIPGGGGQRNEHGWVEINYKGTWYVCDLTFHREGQRSGYLIHYGQKGTWRYSDYHQIP